MNNKLHENIVCRDEKRFIEEFRRRESTYAKNSRNKTHCDELLQSLRKIK
jgi:hypothetical protein